MSTSNLALLITAIIVFIVIIIGFISGSDKSSRESIEQWSIGGRNFGGLLIWFLIGADIYTAYTFLGLTGYAYTLGAPAFFACAYAALAFPIIFYYIPKIWSVAAEFKMTTLADYVRERFDSKFLSGLVALVGILFLIPYIDLQLAGIQNVVKVAGHGTISPTVILIISFLLVGTYTFFSGLRAPAWTALVKDILVWVVMLFLVIYLPIKWFGGWGDFLHVAAEKYPEYMTLPGHGGGHGSFWFSTAAFISAVALFMWPHSSTGALAAKSGESLRKNAIALPFYNILLFFITALGILALLVVPGLKDSNSALLILIQKSLGGVGQGFSFATIMLASLVPASIMVIAASNLLATNIIQDLFAKSMQQKKVTLMARLFVFLIVLLALMFGILFPSSIINLQLQGTSGIVQIFPAVAVSLYWKKMNKVPVTVGLIGGLVMIFLAAPLHLPGYSGFWGILVNIALILILTPFFAGKTASSDNKVVRFLFEN
ncbi:SSS family solute:Na+ symporter [Scopulibacillus darangshiensis]|uniref:SSS family solute:Na+ symporter n=1 Tax=Scopulibacillus darangshiensis TaxID=442528 RepID=A0A4R2P8S7_9BACL|nr:sodium:solute symporter family protein [Scopulibacillus darangshiensis]TCP30594.1 SSS family solute:Na+ symporter [Scopulibacillus darangshiensis]